jgi:phosphatidylglycerophosphate synthase
MKNSYYVINGITVYRLVAAPFLIYLIFTGQAELFKWLLAFSFFTDLIDGFLARQFKVTSIFGAKLDSIADDFTILAGIIGMIILKPDFYDTILYFLIGLLILFAFQTTLALIKYKKTTSFHTYLAKAAAIFQGTFLILLFFLPSPNYFLFYAAAIVTGLDLIEEIILVILLPTWKTNVKGLPWIIRKKSS